MELNPFKVRKKIDKMARHPFDPFAGGGAPTEGEPSDGRNAWGGHAQLAPGTSWELAQDAEARYLAQPQQPMQQPPMQQPMQPMQGQVAGLQDGGKILGIPGGGALAQLTGGAPVTKPMPQAEAAQANALASLMGEEQAAEQRRRRAAQAQMFGGDAYQRDQGGA